MTTPQENARVMIEEIKSARADLMSLLWLTDRTHYVMGLGRCRRERYLTKHAGPGSCGLVLKATSVPQMRGIYIHHGIAFLFATVQAEDREPTPDEIRHAVSLSTQAYLAVVEARGLRQLDGSDRLETVIQEQTALLTGVIWSFALDLLPHLHHTYRVVSIEAEEVAVLDCTCGLGDLVLTQAEHDARGCQGIGWQSKADVILERRGTGVLSYWELKSTGYQRRVEDYETTIQFAAGVLGAEQRLERLIDECFVLNLIVGKREASYDYATKEKTGPLRQQSIFCYGYRKLPQAPGLVEEWAAEYDYVDEHGNNRRLGKGWEKAPVWEMDRRLTGGIDPAEYWVRFLGPTLRGKQLAILGPIQRPTTVLEGFKQEVVYEERRWQQDVWAAYEVISQHGWGSAEAESILNELFPRSWECRRFGQRYECQHVWECHKNHGREDPLANGYILRRPHHLPEVEQTIARGVEVPNDEGEIADE